MEVKKTPKSTTWYNAVLLDVKGENVVVGFEGNVWPTREVAAASVRPCPPSGLADEDIFQPEVDDDVEVFFSATEASPSGWLKGKVKTVKTDFYFISSVGGVQRAQEFIVERSSLRPCSAEYALDTSSYERRVVPVPQDLHAWVRSQDSLGCLSHVQKSSGLVLTSCQNLEAASKASPQVVLVGPERALALGEKLLTQIHFKHQLEMQKFHEQREVYVKRLEEWQEWYSTRHSQTFMVDQSLVGRMIGKKGENLKKVREKYDVEIKITDNASGLDSKVVVVGETAESVHKARDELELVTERLELKQDQVGWVLGKGYQNISDIAKKTDLLYARFDDNNGCLELCGSRSQVEDARMLIQVHAEYQTVYKSMDEEQSQMRQSFEKLDAQDSKGPGKGPGKGTGKGSRKGGAKKGGGGGQR